ncbi:MAG: glycosyltransferase family 2 protein [Myxococcota bacterium]|nr:glycosyltransferase family 2 protein [Myxococcota bacterium]MDW8361685.1 glycosyltransferase family 2 protein [Myxococcales bacterium]
MTAGSPSVSIVVFAYDEAPSVGAMLAELRGWLEAHEPRAEIVLVDDGSRDATVEVAARALSGSVHRIERHARNRGIGAALKTGVAASRAPLVTFLPADGQVPPTAVGVLLERQRRTGADVVLSVYRRRDDGVHRKVLSVGVRVLVAAVHGVWLRSDGPYLFRRALFDATQLPADSFFLNFEFPLRALRAGLHVQTVEVDCRPRRAGRSKSTGAGRIAAVARDLFALRVRRIREGMGRLR